MTPDDIKREAEEIVNKWHGDGVGVCPEHGAKGIQSDDEGMLFCDLHDEESPDLVSDRTELQKAISQALLSSRNQGYQEGVEDAVKAVGSLSQDGSDEAICADCQHKALSSLKDKLKPKEKV